jgi:hypothetical protein
MNTIDDVFESLKTFECEMIPIPWGGGLHGTANAFYGQKHTEEVRLAMSISRKGMNLGNKNADTAGEKNPCFGKFGGDHPAYGHKKSDDFKKKMSDRIKGVNNPFFNIPREDHHKTKFSLEELSEIKNKFLSGMTRTEIYNYYNGKYSLSTIKRAVR